jgi:hypothetical protein
MSPATFTFTDYNSFREVYDAAGFTMARERTKFEKILVTAVVCLLLCAMVAGEFPELLSLADNAMNEFTVVQAKSVALHVLVQASSRQPVTETDGRIIATTLLFSQRSPFQETASTPSTDSGSGSVLRT